MPGWENGQLSPSSINIDNKVPLNAAELFVITMISVIVSQTKSVTYLKFLMLFCCPKGMFIIRFNLHSTVYIAPCAIWSNLAIFCNCKC